MKKKFSSVKVSEEMLLFLKEDKHYTIDKDGYNWKIGGASLQKKNDKVDRPIRYSSNTLSYRELCFKPTHRDCFAVVRVVLLLCP